MQKTKAGLPLIQVLLVCASLAIVCLPSCKKKTEPTGYANVLFVNGCSGAGTISVKINNATVDGVSTIVFPGYTGYRKVLANTNANVSFFKAAGNFLYTGNTNFSPNTNYSVYVTGLSTGPGFAVTTDEMSLPAKGKAKVRFINLSSDNFNEEFYVSGQKLDSNIGYTMCTPFFEVDAGDSVNILVQDPAYLSAQYIAQLSNKVFDTGKIYTVMLSGTYLGTNGAFLRVGVINNN